MDPDHVVLVEQGRQFGGKQAVDAEIGLEETVVEQGQVGAIVEQGPQRAVGVAVVIKLDVRLGQGNGGEGEASGFHDLWVHIPALAGLSVPAEPQAAALFEGGEKSHRHPAGAGIA